MVPVWFHVVPIWQQCLRFLASPGPGAQKPCGSCVVPRGSMGAVTQETAIPSEASNKSCGSCVVPRGSTQRLHFRAPLTNMGAPRNTTNIIKLGKRLAKRFHILVITI